MKFNELTKELRARFRLNQKDLAAILNVSQQNLSRWERGENSPPLLVYCLIAYCFELPLELVTDYDHLIHAYKQVLEKPALPPIDSSGQAPSEYPEISSLALYQKALRLHEDCQAQGLPLSALLEDAALIRHRVEAEEAFADFKKGDWLFFRESRTLKNGYCLWLDEKGERVLRRIERIENKIVLSDPTDQVSSRILSRQSLKQGQPLGYLQYVLRQFDA